MARIRTPKDKIELGYQLWLKHEDWSWDQIGEGCGVNPSTIRHILKSLYGITLHSPRPSATPTQSAAEDEIVAFFFGIGKRNQEQTARHFNISRYRVSERLMTAGYPELISPSWRRKLMNRLPQSPEAISVTSPIAAMAKPSTTEDNGNLLSQLHTAIGDYLADIATNRSLRAENDRLNARLAAQLEINKQLQVLVAKYEAILARPD